MCHFLYPLGRLSLFARCGKWSVLCPLICFSIPASTSRHEADLWLWTCLVGSAVPVRAATRGTDLGWAGGSVAPGMMVVVSSCSDDVAHPLCGQPRRLLMLLDLFYLLTELFTQLQRCNSPIMRQGLLGDKLIDLFIILLQ